ncbi:hypothetical protein [Paracoccus fistulariae]|uniref:Succinate dehydrogenase n=1 Tax=Paracoccus fistulariae TaxID=658446 RepID=A0ABY7SMR3_9RHOB|nr:hypothetical protein [Paracoccus fistulariae]MDB6180123.1 hypothetical protein [Paracoccus fistulariae]WCR08208.1 hypothetical protein JHX87_05180 [Paracoccus fistulariae]
MRFQLFAAFGVAALSLSACVAPVPLATTTTTTTPGVTTPAQPATLDAASRQIARNVINTEMQKRLPGANVAPYTDCVINNATTAELIDIAQASTSGVSGTADSVATIVSRPATTQCIASAARSAGAA